MNSIITLDKLKKGDKGIIIGFKEDKISSKIFKIGLIPGMEIKINNISPFKGPICIRMRNGLTIAITSEQAKNIFIK